MRRLALLVPLCIANLGQAPAVKGGTVTGTVVAVVKGDRIAVDNVYVYLEGGPTKPSRALGTNIVAKIEQKKEQFTPRITVIPQGSTVFFPNRDDFEHNVFSPAMKRNDWYGFDLGKYGANKTGRDRKFLQVGEFDIYCDIHKDMRAKVKVVPTRHFTRVVDGKFTFTDIPPGTYTLVAWAPDSRESRSPQPFAVTAAATTTTESLNLQYTTSSPSHPRMDGSVYQTYPAP